jgi:hypothetical protein
MASFGIIAALTVVTGACVLLAVPASAQTARPIPAASAPAAVAQVIEVNQGFARCPQSADQYADIMKQLVSSAARARARAEENPLLESDAAFYEAELAATRKCAARSPGLGTETQNNRTQFQIS